MNRLTESTTVGQVRQVANIIRHPQYDPSSNGNDIAIISLDRPLDLSISASTASLCIPRHNTAITINQVSSDADTCSTTIHHPNLQFCAGVNGGGKDTCQGDSGGPLMHFESTQRRWMLVGITSYGKCCANPFYSGVYTRVAAYTNWLRSHIVNDGLVEVDVSDSGVKSSIPIRTVSSTQIATASFPMSNDSPLTITSYGFTVLFAVVTFVTFCHHF
ncbi:unnamed protein product [Rotaria magnacalcarata]|uniref:Peptidase S1 domain-containing protein n=1 Tax=Rotaria magnacalcarata TaxID=392030 RepID=A0A820BIW3_9BILA|nr:unnamed protein product [Rotaria magnacalcarata]CAF4202355.1 unnamed protein product [Rotaria magnacalcarata]CAF4221588.1 unnamed protein product [Rotaria magnacalcarata]